MSDAFLAALADMNEADEAANRAGNTGAAIFNVAIEKLREDPDQPRDDLDTPKAQAELEGLAQTIRERGVLQPITLRPLDLQTGFYTIRYGHRRYRASRLAGLETVPAIIREDNGDELDQLTDQILENEQRAPLTAGQMARFVGRLVKLGVKPAEIAKRLGKPKSQISYYIAITDLPPVLEPLADELGARTLAELKAAYDLDAEAATEFVKNRDPREITQVAARAFALSLKQPETPVVESAPVPLPSGKVAPAAVTPEEATPPASAEVRERPQTPAKGKSGSTTPKAADAPPQAGNVVSFAQANEERPSHVRALSRLFDVANGATDESKPVIEFLLAFANAPLYGGFNVAHLWAMHNRTARDAVEVMAFLAEQTEPVYFEDLGFADEIRKIADQAS